MAHTLALDCIQCPTRGAFTMWYCCRTFFLVSKTPGTQGTVTYTPAKSQGTGGVEWALTSDFPHPKVTVARKFGGSLFPPVRPLCTFSVPCAALSQYSGARETALTSAAVFWHRDDLFIGCCSQRSHVGVSHSPTFCLVDHTCHLTLIFPLIFEREHITLQVI